MLHSEILSPKTNKKEIMYAHESIASSTSHVTYIHILTSEWLDGPQSGSDTCWNPYSVISIDVHQGLHSRNGRNYQDIHKC